MRAIRALLLFLVGALVGPNLTWSQGPGGFLPPKGGFGSSPDERFNRFSGGKDVIVVAELDGRMRRGWQYASQALGLTGDRITREEFKAAATKMDMQLKAGGGPPGFPGGGSPPFGAPDFKGPPGGPPGGPPMPSGNQASTAGDRTDRAAERRFLSYDKNNDGKLSYEEMSEELQRERPTWDKNGDGFIDLNEFKEYFKARVQSRMSNFPAPNFGPGGGNVPQIEGMPVDPVPTEPVEDPRPTVYRAGKLPKELPEWFVKLDRDGDNDGQVALYEWRVSGRPLSEFTAMDLNGDGLITPEEYLRYAEKHKPKTPSPGEAAVAGPGFPPPGGLPPPGGALPLPGYGFPNGTPPTGFSPPGATGFPAPDGTGGLRRFGSRSGRDRGDRGSGKNGP